MTHPEPSSAPMSVSDFSKDLSERIKFGYHIDIPHIHFEVLISRRDRAITAKLVACLKHYLLEHEAMLKTGELSPCHWVVGKARALIQKYDGGTNG